MDEQWEVEPQYSCAFWCDYAETTNLKPFLNTVKMIKSHWTGINNYNESKINNIILEGINSKVQLVKKICCRFSNLSMNSKKALL
ncbi:transposase [Crocinitomicaceae bacterium]|nr:transposase [Crocinitomicaceae bacterium]